MIDLLTPLEPDRLELRDGMVLMRRFAASPLLLAGIEAVAAISPFRRLTTPGGKVMSVAMTCCGPLGWHSDRHGYRYVAIDPLTGAPWPVMPAAFADLAVRAAAAAGYPGFRPDACLINRYEIGSRLSAHQDRDEGNFGHPIVSVSIGLGASFFAGLTDSRSGPSRTVVLDDGDVVCWGGPARLAYHGIKALKPGTHPLTGPRRFNLTFRRAG